MNWKDSPSHQARKLEGEGKFAEAAALWEQLPGELDRAIASYVKADQVDHAAGLLKVNGRGMAAAELYQSVGQHTKAAATYEEIFEFLPAAKALMAAGATERAAAMFEQADAFTESAAAYLQLGNLLKAAQLYERAGQPEQAAEVRARVPAGDPSALEPELDLSSGLIDAERVIKAIVVYLRTDRPDEGARLYASCQEKIGYSVLAAIAGNEDVERCAAEMFSCANDFAMAAQVLDNLGDYESAAAMYERADDPYVAAEVFLRVGDQGRAAEMYERAGHFRQAADCYLAAEKRESAASCYERSENHLLAGQLYGGLGKHSKAMQLLQKITKGDPDYAAARRLLDQSRGAVGSLLPAGNVVPVVDGFEFLKSTPLFRDFSLDEMKAVYDLCTTRRLEPGEALITQDQPGATLYVLHRGTAKVLRQTARGEVEQIARLGPGSPAGEMSLVDDAPTSATVQAESVVDAFGIDRQAFQKLVASSDRMAVKLYRFFAVTLAKRLRQTNEVLGVRASADRT